MLVYEGTSRCVRYVVRLSSGRQMPERVPGRQRGRSRIIVE